MKISNGIIMRFPCWREFEASYPYRTHLWRSLGLSYAVSANKGMVYNHIPLSGGHWQIETGKAFLLLLHLIQIVEITRENLLDAQGELIDLHIERYGMAFGLDEDDAGCLLHAIALGCRRVGTSTIASV